MISENSYSIPIKSNNKSKHGLGVAYAYMWHIARSYKNQNNTKKEKCNFPCSSLGHVVKDFLLVLCITANFGIDLIPSTIANTSTNIDTFDLGNQLM